MSRVAALSRRACSLLAPHHGRAPTQSYVLMVTMRLVIKEATWLQIFSWLITLRDTPIMQSLVIMTIAGASPRGNEGSVGLTVLFMF